MGQQMAVLKLTEELLTKNKTQHNYHWIQIHHNTFSDQYCNFLSSTSLSSVHLEAHKQL